MATLAAFVLSWVVGYAICRAVLGAAWKHTPLTLRWGLAWAAGAAFSGMTTFWATALRRSIAARWSPAPPRPRLAFV